MLAFGIPSLREDEGERPRLVEKLLKALRVYLTFKKGKIAREPWTRAKAQGGDMKERVGKGKMAVIVNTTWLHGLCIYFYFFLELITSSTFGIQQSVTTRSFKW